MFYNYSSILSKPDRILCSKYPSKDSINELLQNGALFMENLSQGTLLILDEGGHGSNGDDSCINQVMIDFMNDPQGSLDDSCLNLYKE